jgi:mannose-6-phosphate isomerase
MPRLNPGLVLEDGNNRRVLCCAGPHFALERWKLGEAHAAPTRQDRCLTLSNVGESSVQLRHGGGVEALGRAESCVLPAAIGEVDVVPDGEADLVVCYVPDVGRDIVGPLREAGHSDEEIRGLGQVDV